MKKILYSLCSLIFFISSCKSGNNHEGHDHSHTHDHELVLSEELPPDFLQFYMKFFADTTYQLEHIVFPVKMRSDGTYHQKDNWEYHVPFINDDENFIHQFQHVSGLVLETIQDKKGLFKVERRYVKSGDAYNLIYYTRMNAFENSDDWEVVK